MARTSLLSRRALRLLGVVAAALVGLITWLIAVPALGINLRVIMNGAPQSVGMSMIAMVAVLGSIAAWGALAIFERATRHPARNFTATSLVVCAVSLAGPLTSAVTVPAGLVLCVMHVAVAGTITSMLLASGRRHSRMH